MAAEVVPVEEVRTTATLCILKVFRTFCSSPRGLPQLNRNDDLEDCKTFRKLVYLWHATGSASIL